MTTSSSSGLSPEAKEFVPVILNPSSTTIPTIYSSDQQAMIYPLMKYPEMDFRMPPNQQFHLNTNNTSQIMLLPTPGCYPATQILYPPHEQSSVFYPIDYNPCSLMNYSLSHPNSIRISSARQQNGANHSNTPSSEITSFNARRNFHSTNSKHQPKSNRARPNQQQYEQRKDIAKSSNNNQVKMNGTLFKLRTEDFPSLPMGNSQPEKTAIQSQTSVDTKSTPSWNKVVSSPRPRSTSTHSASSENQQSRKTKSPTPTKQSEVTPQKQRSHSLTRDNKTQEKQHTKPANETDAQTKQNQKSSKQKKTKPKEEPVITTKAEEGQQQQQPSIPFTLDDENSFPALGQETSVSATKESNHNTSMKTTTSTPGLISKSKMKANHTYQIRLQDMFNALNTAIQNKQNNTQQKSSMIGFNGANPLDSNPAPKRGKEREHPKAHKPTKLKRIINKELEENQKQRQQLLTKVANIKQTDDGESQNETDVITDDYTNDASPIKLHDNTTECTSASCTEESNNDTDDDDEDEDMLDHEPTSQLQTPYAQQMPQSNIKQQIHDAGFREYCSQLIDRQLDELCIQLLITLKRFQDRKKQQFQSNPERARRKRRFVHGIREVTKHLRLQRLKCVLIAPDCQSIQSEGGLNDAIDQIISLCKEQSIPYIFTLNRQKLGRCLNKIARISTIGIFDYSGADELYKQIIGITDENQRAYKQIIDNIINQEDAAASAPSHGLNSREFYKILHRTFQQQNQPRQYIVNTIPDESRSRLLPKVAAHHAHSRQTSDASTIYIDPQLSNSIKKQHTRASSGTFDMGKSSTTKKNHQRTLSDGATRIDDTSLQIKHHVKTHSRTPSGCSAISQIEQQDYFEQSRNMLMNTNDESTADSEENRLKSINEDTEDNSANIKRKNVEKWINDN
ncbi:unnamed protein product [Adineta ricciae]|uniref:Ribosomal protein eL8/eL30/eS12/Gadd45 domain-containing protein n=1 Tax=Adineta ricciae TaxID=249248 RepID=A0A813RYN5_ADIRI|nr:unnamed protein product [Adineta ricciae]CAF1095561.1 unnamed protein product [Adineta ricciae]